jgi:hypothetical protein
VAEPLIASSTTKPAAAQARLILQDPLAYDQATQPALRSSVEMLVEPAAAMEREKARELWEGLSLEPEVAQERQAERKRLLSRADNLAREAAAAKTKALELEAQLAKAEEERLHHPLVYAGAAGLLGLGALWWLERRKRIVLQDRELEMLAQQTPHLEHDHGPSYLEVPGSTYSIEDSPQLATDYATDLHGLDGAKPEFLERHDIPQVFVEPEPVAVKEPSALAEKNVPVLTAEVEPMPDWALPKPGETSSRLPTEEELVAQSWKEDRSLLGMSKRVLGNMLLRKTQREASVSTLRAERSNFASTASTLAPQSTAVQTYGNHDSTQIQFDEESQLAFEQELLSQQFENNQVAGYDPNQANIELLSQTRIIAHRGESAVEHLLELRTAVNGLAALGRPAGALKLLEEHVAADPQTCAWAYLEYMHLCELTNRREDFEGMRTRYRLQFNRMAPYWHEPNSHVLGLDGYARAAGELCASWAQGQAHARNTLTAWLIGPVLGRKLMQLPAYHDLFDLYEMLELSADLEVQAPHPVQSNASSAATLLDLSPLGADFVSDEELQAHDFVPTVSLLDLDYEFSSDVTLEEREVQQSETAVTIVKTGNFSVDFNVAGTQLGSLASVPAVLDKK